MATTEAKYRNRLGRFILISNFAFILLIFVYYLIRGLDTEEFVELMKIIAPIKAAYLTALIRYVITNRNVVSSVENENPAEVNTLFKTTSVVVTGVHIGSLILFVSLYALINLMDFEDLKNIILGIETFFGVYVGLIIAAMFKVEDEE